MRKDVRIRGYFAKPKGVWEKKKIGKHCCNYTASDKIDWNSEFGNWCQNILWLGASFIQSIRQEEVQNVKMNQNTNQKLQLTDKAFQIKNLDIYVKLNTQQNTSSGTSRSSVMPGGIWKLSQVVQILRIHFRPYFNHFWGFKYRSFFQG